MKYDIIERSRLNDLIDAVNNYIARGWKCQGGICVTVAGMALGSQIYYQAMIRD